MMAKNQWVFRLSLFLNLIFLCLSGLWIYRKGGTYYFISKASLAQKPFYITPDYLQKTLQFQNLPDSPQDIIFVGDSLTDQGEWSEIFKNGKIKNRGISGDTTDGVINRLDEIVDGKPQKVFLLIGINDFWKDDKPVSSVFENYRKILKSFKDKTPNTKVYLQSLLPINNQHYSIPIKQDKILEFNQNLQALAKEFSYQYINLYDNFSDSNNQLKAQYTFDGVHLNSQGYLLWKKILQPYI